MRNKLFQVPKTELGICAKLCRRTDTHIALINGERVAYDFGCAYFIENRPNYKYLGQGTIYSIDGIKQRGDLMLHFWKRQINES